MNKNTKHSQKKCPRSLYSRISTLLRNKSSWDSLSELDVRSNYINEMLKELGWNIDNKGLSPLDFEVLSECTIKSGRPDITLRLNGTSVIYIETKRLKHDLNDLDILQVWQYAWSSGHSFSILSNFIETWLIDCRSTPPKSKSNTTFQRNVIFRWNASTLDKQWHTIHSILSKKSITNGSLIELEEGLQKKVKNIRGIQLEMFQLRGSFPIDKHFLEQLDQWRFRIVKNVHSSHPKWSSKEVVDISDQLLNFIVFTRVLEDQGMEPSFPLKKILDKSLSSNIRIIRDINHLRSDLNAKYNGTVFKELPIDLDIDVNLIIDILQNIYPPDCPYRLDFLPVEMLGTIYERYLGSGLKFIKGKIKLSDEKKTRRESGVFYTERYITNFMVMNVLGNVLNKMTPKTVFNLRIADISCGSGSFLIAAYRSLIFWLQQKAIKKDIWREDYLERLKDGSWKVKLEIKLKLLQNCIFGVDIDSEAVSVTKFSLYLQALSGETESSICKLWKIKKRPILPILDRNIQCGNSLVRIDITDNILIKSELKNKLNPFDLEEKFQEIFDEKGFSIILGNPPYNAKLSLEEKEYCRKYKLAHGNLNTANLFIERTLNLLRPNGSWCLIVPKSLAYSDKWSITRNYLKDKISIAVDASKAFKDVRLEQVIIGALSGDKFFKTGTITEKKCKVFNGTRNIKYTDILPVNISKEELSMGKAIKESTNSMEKYFRLKRGTVPLSSLRPTGQIKVLQGRYIQGYSFIEPAMGISERQAIDCINETPQFKYPKIIAQQIVAHSLNPTPHVRLISMVDFNGHLGVDTVSNLLPIKLPESKKETNFFMLFSLGLFNSRAMSWFADRFVYDKAIRTMHLDNCHISKLRFPKKDLLFTKAAQSIVELVQERIDMRISQFPNNKEKYFRDCLLLEKEIDNCVYKLFGLAPKQKRMIDAVFGDECLAEMGMSSRNESSKHWSGPKIATRPLQQSFLE